MVLFGKYCIWYCDWDRWYTIYIGLYLMVWLWNIIVHIMFLWNIIVHIMFLWCMMSMYWDGSRWAVITGWFVVGIVEVNDGNRGWVRVAMGPELYD